MDCEQREMGERSGYLKGGFYVVDARSEVRRRENW